MNEELFLKINASIAEVEKAFDSLKGDVDNLGKSLDKQNTKLKDTDKAFKGLKKSGVVFQELDKFTGGLASSWVDVYNGIRTSSKAIGVFKAALISTGIGALLVAVGLIVENWDKILEAVGLTNNELERQADILNSQLGVNSAVTALFDQRIKRYQQEGRSAEEINKVEKQRFEALQAEIKRTEDLVETRGRLLEQRRREALASGGINAEEQAALDKLQVEYIRTGTALERLRLKKQEILEASGEEIVLIGKRIKAEKKATEAYESSWTKWLREGSEAVVQFESFLAKRDFDSVFNFDQAIDPNNLGVKDAEREIKQLEELIKSVRSNLGRLGEGLSDKDIVNIIEGGSAAVEAYKQQVEATLIATDALSQGATAAIRDVFNSLYEQFQTGNAIIDAFLNAFITTFETIIQQLVTNFIAQKLLNKGQIAAQQGVASANAVTAATSFAATVPFGFLALPGLIAGALAQVTGVFAGLQSFSTGGLVSGDQNIVRVNGNELILNPNQQATLYNMLRNNLPPMSTGSINRDRQEGLVATTKIKGSDILLSVERAKRKNNRFG